MGLEAGSVVAAEVGAIRTGAATAHNQLTPQPRIPRSESLPAETSRGEAGGGEGDSWGGVWGGGDGAASGDMFGGLNMFSGTEEGAGGTVAIESQGTIDGFAISPAPKASDAGKGTAAFDPFGAFSPIHIEVALIQIDVRAQADAEEDKAVDNLALAPKHFAEFDEVAEVPAVVLSSDDFEEGFGAFDTAPGGPSRANMVAPTPLKDEDGDWFGGTAVAPSAGGVDSAEAAAPPDDDEGFGAFGVAPVSGEVDAVAQMPPDDDGWFSAAAVAPAAGGVNSAEAVSLPDDDEGFGAFGIAPVSGEVDAAAQMPPDDDSWFSAAAVAPADGGVDSAETASLPDDDEGFGAFGVALVSGEEVDAAAQMPPDDDGWFSAAAVALAAGGADSAEAASLPYDDKGLGAFGVALVSGEVDAAAQMPPDGDGWFGAAAVAPAAGGVDLETASVHPLPYDDEGFGAFGVAQVSGEVDAAAQTPPNDGAWLCATDVTPVARDGDDIGPVAVAAHPLPDSEEEFGAFDVASTADGWNAALQMAPNNNHWLGTIDTAPADSASGSATVVVQAPPESENNVAGNTTVDDQRFVMSASPVKDASVLVVASACGGRAADEGSDVLVSTGATTSDLAAEDESFGEFTTVEVPQSSSTNSHVHEVYLGVGNPENVCTVTVAAAEPPVAIPLAPREDDFGDLFGPMENKPLDGMPYAPSAPVQQVVETESFEPVAATAVNDDDDDDDDDEFGTFNDAPPRSVATKTELKTPTVEFGGFSRSPVAAEMASQPAAPTTDDGFDGDDFHFVQAASTMVAVTAITDSDCEHIAWPREYTSNPASSATTSSFEAAPRTVTSTETLQPLVPGIPRASPDLTGIFTPGAADTADFAGATSPAPAVIISSASSWEAAPLSTPSPVSARVTAGYGDDGERESVKWNSDDDSDSEEFGDFDTARATPSPPQTPLPHLATPGGGGMGDFFGGLTLFPATPAPSPVPVVSAISEIGAQLPPPSTPVTVAAQRTLAAPSLAPTSTRLSVVPLPAVVDVMGVPVGVVSAVTPAISEEVVTAVAVAVAEDEEDEFGDFSAVSSPAGASMSAADTFAEPRQETTQVPDTVSSARRALSLDMFADEQLSSSEVRFSLGGGATGSGGDDDITDDDDFGGYTEAVATAPAPTPWNQHSLGATNATVASAGVQQPRQLDAMNEVGHPQQQWQQQNFLQSGTQAFTHVGLQGAGAPWINGQQYMQPPQTMGWAQQVLAATPPPALATPAVVEIAADPFADLSGFDRGKQ